MRKLMTTTMLIMVLGIAGLSLAACNQNDDGGGDSAPGTAPSTPTQTVPNEGAPGAGGMGSQNGGMGSGNGQ